MWKDSTELINNFFFPSTIRCALGSCPPAASQEAEPLRLAQLPVWPWVTADSGREWMTACVWASWVRKAPSLCSGHTHCYSCASLQCSWAQNSDAPREKRRKWTSPSTGLCFCHIHLLPSSQNLPAVLCMRVPLPLPSTFYIPLVLLLEF